MTEINLIYIVPLILGGWLALSCFISLLGGWFWIARKFPLPKEQGDVIQRIGWGSLNLNYICSYRSCVNIKITNMGIAFKTALIFSVLHRPIFIPWDAISRLEYKTGLIQRTICMVGNHRFVFYGKAAKAIHDAASSKLQDTRQ